MMKILLGFLPTGFTIVIVLIIVISLAFVLFIKYVLNNSYAIRKINELNYQYHFHSIRNFNMSHRYDNEKMYNEISPKDYLTYELQFIKKEVNKALKETLDNKANYENYLLDVKDKCIVGKNVKYPQIKWLFVLVEKWFLKNKIKKPVTMFAIRIKLILTNIDGYYKNHKTSVFSAGEIYDLIYKLNKKNGTFYLSKDIWDSICKVERGKVSNKMRFAIYQRDNNRCRYCGRRNVVLEVDHIIPIAKGGKSTMDNLQTLCHDCNVKKGDKIQYYYR